MHWSQVCLPVPALRAFAFASSRTGLSVPAFYVAFFFWNLPLSRSSVCVLRMKLLLPPIYIEHNKGPCRCLILERDELSSLCDYSQTTKQSLLCTTYVNSSKAVRRADGSTAAAFAVRFPFSRSEGWLTAWMRMVWLVASFSLSVRGLSYFFFFVMILRLNR